MKTTLGRHCPNEEVPIRLKQSIEADLAQQRKSLTGMPGAERKFAALGDLLLFLGERGPEATDPRTYAFWIAACNGEGSVDNFTPTRTMKELIARLGDRPGPVPPADVTLTELAIVALVDTIENLQGMVGAADRERDAAVETARQKVAKAAKAEELEKELKEAREVIAGLNGDLAEEKANTEFLRGRLIDDAPPEDAPPVEPKKAEKPRRTSVPGETGIYYNEVVEGRPYEINYRDSDKKQHWETVGPDLEEARARRALLNGQPYMQGVAA